MTTARLLDHADLAEMFGTDVDTVVRWRRTYDWPCTRVGRLTKYTEDQVAEILRRQARGGRLEVVAGDGRTARSAARKRSA